MTNSIKILLNPFTVRHKTIPRARNMDAKETKPRVHTAVCPVEGSHESFRRERLELMGEQCTASVNLCHDSRQECIRLLLLIFSSKSCVYKGSKLNILHECNSTGVSKEALVPSSPGRISNLSPKGT